MDAFVLTRALTGTVTAAPQAALPAGNFALDAITLLSAGDPRGRSRQEVSEWAFGSAMP